jgi:hypothetical protein
MKRSRTCVSNNNKNKKIKVDTVSLSEQKIMVSATHLYNYMMQDTLVDWLKLSNRRGTRNSPEYTNANGFTEFIMNKGHEFESKLISYINTNIMKIVTVSEHITEDSLQQTKDYMMEGRPIIHSAPVQNNNTHTQGIIDLLIRSDYINKITEHPALSDEETVISSPILNKPYHYVVIDIKFSSLPLCSDGIHLLNSGSYPAYKAQCLIYTQAVGLIQGFTAPYSFILGRKWKYTKGTIINSNNSCLNKLGKISYDSIDSNYKLRTEQAIQWVRDVKTNGHTWSIFPPSRLELYPNMCVDSGKWNGEKEKIATRIGEMTTIWRVGIKQRNFALTQGIKSWHDTKCTSKQLNIHGSYATIIDSIMEINRQEKDTIRPSIIKSSLYNWRDNSNDVFVDFETLGDIFSDFSSLPENSKSDMIFMIGVGWSENGIWNYNNFTCSKPSHEEEYRIMNEFSDFIRTRKNPKMYYWHAESNFWNIAENRQFSLGNTTQKELISNNWKITNWADMCNLFRSEPIVIKDCFKFGLKAIASAMRKHGMISTCNHSECNNGVIAMIEAWQSYSNPESSDKMKDIITYNEFDCKVLWEILEFLRTNH